MELFKGFRRTDLGKDVRSRWYKSLPGCWVGTPNSGPRIRYASLEETESGSGMRVLWMVTSRRAVRAWKKPCASSTGQFVPRRKPVESGLSCGDETARGGVQRETNVANAAAPQDPRSRGGEWPPHGAKAAAALESPGTLWEVPFMMFLALISDVWYSKDLKLIRRMQQGNQWGAFTLPP